MKNPLSNNPFAIKEDAGTPAPRQIYGWRIYLVAISAAWASAMYGYDSAFIGGTLELPSFKAAYGLTDEASSTSLDSNIVSTFQAGAFFGAIGGFFIAESLGRKMVILTSGVVFSIGVVLQMLGILGALYGGRVLTGLGVGASSMIIPIYISECAPAAIRGRLVGMFEIMLQIALVFGFWVNYGVQQNISPDTDTQWRIPVGIQFVPAGLLLLSMPWVPESPRWLVSMGRSEKALTALSWIRNLPQDHEYVLSELADFQTAVNHEIESAGGKRNLLQIFRELGQPGVRNRASLGMIMMLFQNLTGINAINYYSPTILESIGYSGTSVNLLATGVYGIVKMVTTLIFMLFCVDRIGRRPALLVGAVGAGVAMFYLAGYSKLSGSFTSSSVPRDAGANAALAMIYVYAVFYGFSWNGVPWLTASEIMPTRVRTASMMLSVCTQWLSQFVVVYSLPYMVANITYGTFLFFGACTVAAFIFAYLFVPETKGVALEDMDLLFGEGAPLLAHNARKRYDTAHEAGITAVGLERAEDKQEREFVEVA
ncbi:Sugar/inositol transporter [Lasiodiplodia theobromae]|uniref:MFS quinate transporter n=1 Tax=Lasiodiplodia theobromae TaxID=45133 RepID=UPI0015C371FA|nr:MFS quinate transporter [Lasiodiplodia theobromae]KAF4544943.1 MFS quinate transporter [Lasiodiplodia theobromae]KAF9631594.1 Sugar/inositol transporter [Lasiodiplodia theobromae]